MDYSKYPKNWKTEICSRILARAGHCCVAGSARNGSFTSRGIGIDDWQWFWYNLFDGGKCL